ncbi:hypothetical protein SAMN05192575_109113 [Nocardioides alpinus]|uniref:CopC domain-containing protein n=1 Tax=Nocardioides alpinus TaxID=748909 RepID=A0A1I1APB0_9ACTN|nr:copper resistance CopC family protein [Nocardioides alpinus]SFB38163.1 hypothetical protein SAMN05192575_109113 [Nocardioides alpinus]
MSSIRTPLALVVAALAFVGANLVISPAQAHTDFIGSDPRDGARLDEVPRELRLEFSDEMDPGLSTVTLQVEGGDSTPLELQSGQSRNVLLAAMPTSPDPGEGTTTSWEVAFRVVSRDGHPVAGTVRFVVRNRALPVPDESSSAGEIATEDPTDQRTPAGRETWPLVAVAVGALLLLVLAAGTVMRLVRRDTHT